MYKFSFYRWIAPLGLCLATASCRVPALLPVAATKPLPESYGRGDTTQSTLPDWRHFFTDPKLCSLIDTALQNNQELEITLQEIEIARNEIRIRKGALLPFVAARAGTGVEKVGRYTSQGAGDASTELAPGKNFPDPLTDQSLSLNASWEIDIWKKLRNAKKAAVSRYLASVEGKNFVITNLVAEVAHAYYELLALDNQLVIVRQNIVLQQNVLELLQVQKEAARATELAVQKFRAEVLKSQSLEFDLVQQIREAENRIHLLLGQYPREIPRDTSSFLSLEPAQIRSGLPAQLLANRPDIKQAELALAAAKLDVKVARAEFYPSLGITAAIGIQAFNPSYLVKLPESLLFSLAGELAGPLINRNAIQAEFHNANARQLQALYQYERTLVQAYLEVANQLSRMENLDQRFQLRSKQVEALNRSVEVSNDLFRAARADYLEVLMTQRDALEARLELIETHKDQMNTVIDIYKDLGGGWK